MRLLRSLIAGFAVLCSIPATAVQPAEGFYTRLYQPGTGLNVQLRGNLLAVAQYEFRDGVAHWRLGTAPLHGDTALVQLHEYADGSCLGCSLHQAPGTIGEPISMQLRFVSARELMVTFEDGFPVPLVLLPFGGRYLDLFLEDAANVAFDLQPLPDLSGRWAVGLPGSWTRLERFSAGHRTADGGMIFSSATYQLECLRADGIQAAGCYLRTFTPARRIAFAAAGDITLRHIAFAAEPGIINAPAVAVRFELPEFDAQPDAAPAAGFWAIPGRPGTGLHLHQEGPVLGVAMLDFRTGTDGAGSATWLVGAGSLDPGGASVDLVEYVDGSCFGCNPGVPPQPVGQRSLRLDFDTARTAWATLPDGAVVPLVHVAFGAEHVDASQFPSAATGHGSLALPDLKGTWVLPITLFDWGYGVSTEEWGGYTMVLDTGPLRVGEALRWSSSGDSIAAIECVPGSATAPARCTLDLLGHDSIFDPVALLGDVEENRIRFSVEAMVPGPEGSPSTKGVFHAVRIPDGD